MRSSRALLITLTLTGLLQACATAPVRDTSDPRALLASACAPGTAVKEVQGGVWLKAQSPTASGQFPAEVRVSAPDQLRMEVTNLIGGTEAVITVEGRKYSVDVPSRSKRKNLAQKGTDSWGGIPLRWATDLFLGRVPCPAEAEWKDADIAIGKDSELVVKTQASLGHDQETFVYRFRSWAGKPWVEALDWDRKGVLSAAVKFKFDDPEDSTRSPRRWEAASAQGEVKVRWKDRKTKL